MVEITVSKHSKPKELIITQREATEKLGPVAAEERIVTGRLSSVALETVRYDSSRHLPKAIQGEGCLQGVQADLWSTHASAARLLSMQNVSTISTHLWRRGNMYLLLTELCKLVVENCTVQCRLITFFVLKITFYVQLTIVFIPWSWKSRKTRKN